MGPPCHCLKSFFPAGQQFWGEIAPKMPYAHLYFKTTTGKKQDKQKNREPVSTASGSRPAEMKARPSCNSRNDHCPAS